MNRVALLLASLLLTAVPSVAAEDIRLERYTQDVPGGTDTVYTTDETSTDAMDMGGDSGSGDLAIKIERNGFAGGDEDDDSSSGLSRDGGFNFGSVR